MRSASSEKSRAVQFSNFSFSNLEKTEVHASLTALSNITNLKKLCNHPDLVYDKIFEGADGFENAAKLMPPNYNKKCVRNDISC